MKTLLSTKEVAEFLGINEKMVYSLISEKGLPASKITGKWLFPRHLVNQWVENNTVNFPESVSKLPHGDGLLVIAGSNDLLLDKAMTLFNTLYPDQLVVFGNLGSMGGIRALRRNICHMAASHLLEEQDGEYNFDVAGREMDRMPVVVNFCKREQGILVAKGNPQGIRAFADLGQARVRVVNRPLGTGTRLLFDHELKKAGIAPGSLPGYDREVARHMDVGLEILAGRADAGPGIRSVAAMLDLDFLPLRMERFDFLVSKERFFDKGIQTFITMMHEKAFQDMTTKLEGYDMAMSGRVVFPREKNVS